MSGRDDARLAWRTFNLNWIPIGALGFSLALGIASTDLSLEPVAFGITAAVALTLALIVYAYAFLKADAADPKLVFWLGTTAQVIMVTAIVGPLSYVANAMNWPLQDQALLYIDRALGLDPAPIATFVNNNPWLERCLNSGYSLIKWPLLGIPIVLALTLRLVRLQQFILALNLALAVTIIVSIFVPAIGTYYGLNLSPQHFPNVNSAIYAGQLRDILALRDGSLRELELFKLAGIVSFPSFHAASAAIFMWALWPVRGLRYAWTAVNGLMLAATPVIGAHYMIDVFGGVALAAISILLGKYFLEAVAPSAAAQTARPAPALVPALD
jgi:membrane-associated phospholipid phosphatase